MKKVLTLFVCAVLLFSLSVTTFAEEYKIELKPSSNTLKPGQTVTITVNVSDSVVGYSAALSIYVSDGLTVKSGNITRTDTVINAFDKNTNKAVSAYSGTVDFKGEFAKIEIAAKNDATGKQTVTVEMIVKPDDKTTSKSIDFDLSKSSSSNTSSNKSKNNNSSKNSSNNSSKNSSGTTSDNTESSGGSAKNKPGDENNTASNSSTGETIGAKSESATNNNNHNNNNIIIIVGSGLVAAVVIALVVTLLIKKKK